jgi:hypothetical protein
MWNRAVSSVMSAERRSHRRRCLRRASVAVSHWLEARKDFTQEGGDTPAMDAAVPGQKWQTYSNCLDNAFETAARTLRARMRDHDAAKADVAEWVQGQDAVFSNCGGPGRIPRELQVGTANWLRQDREYHLRDSTGRERLASLSGVRSYVRANQTPIGLFACGRCTIR